MATKTPKIPFKAGDDFVLTLTVTNKVSAPAIAAATDVIEAQALYDAALLADPQVPVDIAAALVVLNDANDAYAEAIIVDITAWTITASMRWITKLMAEFTVTKTDAATGVFTLEVSHEETQAWKPRVYDVDVQFLIAGKKSSSQTFQIEVKQDITEEAIV
jgi:hypothetical protein